ncbi:hypothetical protein D918_04096 [Trichuris suis]|nr:hypothetical protein D918_04096 [Trichuris suis]
MENEPWIVGIIEKLMPTYGFINCQGRQTYFFQKGSVLTNPDSLRVGGKSKIRDSLYFWSINALMRKCRLGQIQSREKQEEQTGSSSVRLPALPLPAKWSRWGNVQLESLCLQGTSSRAFLVTPILPIEQGYVKEVLEERKRVAIKPLSLENETRSILLIEWLYILQQISESY